jgi:4-alpha-glucanotransferase
MVDRERRGSAGSSPPVSVLDELAERMGIEPEFKDATGKVRYTDPKVSRALLNAMGLAVEDARKVQAVLRDLDRAESGRPLPPVMVVPESGAPLAVPLTLMRGTGVVHWSVREEDGAIREGEVSFAQLAPRRSRKTGRTVERRTLVIQSPAKIGYHWLRIEAHGLDPAEMRLVVAPQRCYLPEGLAEKIPVWGISLQLYLLRSQHNWGIGDFGDLKHFAEFAADLGASVIGLSPLHAMFLDAPENASPYSPASRLFLNALFIDIPAMPEFSAAERVRAMADAPDFQRDLAHCRDAPLVDYATVARLKLPILRALFGVFRNDPNSGRSQAFEDFRRQQGDALERFCRFQALREHFAAQAPRQADWRNWPQEYQDPGSPSVARFAQQHRDRIDCLAWMQWIADQQLAEAARIARAKGMTIGIYRDLAVGADSAGAETWARRDLVVSSAHVGAPPDILNPVGQDWGLPPFNPRALCSEGYSGFIDLVRANMRHAGGLRIDHVMGLQHLYWIPEGRAPSEGAYVSYPLDDLMGILALESHRHRCLVVGEDLGTVPEGFREHMEAAGILSYRVLFFEVDARGTFVLPQDYPPLALATPGSHDLATLRGWWEAHDIELKSRHGLYPSKDEEQRQQEQRAKERVALLHALEAAGLGLRDLDATGPFRPELADAVHAFLARTRAGLAMVQLDDLTDERDQVNLPGTIDQHPNWRRKQSISLEDLSASPRVRALAHILNSARPSLSSRKPPNVR